MTTSESVTAHAPAKINLILDVGARREDGFHELATVYQAVSLFDEVTVHPAPELTVEVEGSGAEHVPTDGTNLAARAVHALAEHTGVDPAVRVRIRKNIPVAGGMAGGSADAAATLLACDALWRTAMTREQLAEIAADLGSDVPFALFGGTAVGTGRGEALTPVLARGAYSWVVVLAEDHLSTPAVYAELDRLRDDHEVPDPPEHGPRVPMTLLQALRDGDPQSLAGELSNDLEAAAVSLLPSLRRTLDLGRDCGALAGIVSGSGPSLVFLVRGSEHALDLAVGLTATGQIAQVHRVHGPVPGARITEAVRA
jgi:4-diphosphocytidyl-2-C-methyl-D-erythritol kinase